MRWFLMCLASGALACLVFSPIQAQHSSSAQLLPDLEIKEIVIKGATAKVLVGNKGSADAGPCRLRMEIFQLPKHAKAEKVLVDTMTINVPAVKKRTTVWVSMTSPVSLHGHHRELKFEVNVTRAVKESHYNNNVKFYPESVR